MKKLLKLWIILIIPLFFNSCFVCNECTIIDETGVPLGTIKLCGDELRKAEKDPYYICE